MATPITNTQITDDTVGLREDLADIVVKIDPVETPVYSNAVKTPATANFNQVYHRELHPVLLNNPCSILSRDWIVSGTLASVGVAGRPNESEMAFQTICRALELRAQVETALLADNVKVPTNLPRENAGLPNYADDGTGALVNQIVTPAHTNAALETSMQLLKAKGVVGRTVLMLPANKKLFSESVQAAAVKNIESAITDRQMPTWEGAVSVYMTDIGLVQMVVDRYLDETLDASFVMDDRHIRVAEMKGRSFAEEVLGKSGDAEQRLLVWEGTIEVGSSNSVATLGAFA